MAHEKPPFLNTGPKATAGSPSATRPASNYPGNVRLAGAGALASIGTVGDSYDNALAESVIGLYKTECVRLDGPFKTVDELELATLSWVHWYNHQRLHSALDHVPPLEYEQAHYRRINPQQQPLSGQLAVH